ncbi:MAG: hypothetical protein K0R92_1947 [Lachnospiraceae bacterium]|nr:hypothetical protein [Lachnospiraceae bacterium]
MINTCMSENDLDFYSINTDFTGSRCFADNQEKVEFHNATTMRIWCNEQSDSYPSHWHTAMEILMPIENHYDIIVNDNSYHVLPGEVLIIPPGEVHALVAPSKGRRFIFLFDITLITKLKGFSAIQSLLVQPLYITPETYPSIYEEVYQLLIQMRNDYFSTDEYSELIITSLLIKFFVLFGYHRINAQTLFPNVRLYKQKEYVQKFNNLITYIDNHYMEDLALESMAKSIGFSKYHFSRIFKQYTNFTFWEYLCYRRIKAAEEFLANPDLSITEIALQSGFPSIPTFNRLFKYYKKCTPSEYRAKKQYSFKIY